MRKFAAAFLLALGLAGATAGVAHAAEATCSASESLAVAQCVNVEVNDLVDVAPVLDFLDVTLNLDSLF